MCFCSEVELGLARLLLEVLIRFAAPMAGQEVVFAVVRLEDGDCIAVAFVRDDGAVGAALVLLCFVFADGFQETNILELGKQIVSLWMTNGDTVSRFASDFSSRLARTTKGFSPVAMAADMISYQEKDYTLFRQSICAR